MVYCSKLHKLFVFLEYCVYFSSVMIDSKWQSFKGTWHFNLHKLLSHIVVENPMNCFAHRSKIQYNAQFILNPTLCAMTSFKKLLNNWGCWRGWARYEKQKYFFLLTFNSFSLIFLVQFYLAQNQLFKFS